MTKVLLSEERITDRGNKEQDRLSMEVKHYDGRYRFNVTKETVETHKEGWQSVQFIVFADGNFNYTVTTGRKSQKKLDTLNNIIEEHKEKLTELWLDGKYQDMCLLVQMQAEIKKVA